MEDKDKRRRGSKGGCRDATVSRRNLIVGLVTATPVVMLAKPALADLFGDVGVLLAQLEQQLQLVSHAIQTVQSLYQTVAHLQNVVNATKTAIHQASNGGLEGFLNGLQGLTQVGLGVTSSLRRIDTDAIWWRNLIASKAKDGTFTYEDAYHAQAAMRQRDQQILQNQQQLSESYGRLSMSYQAAKASNDAVNAAMNEPGVVGQMQLIGRQTAQATGIALHQDEMATLQAKALNDEYARQAAEREATRTQLAKDAEGLHNVNAPNAPVRLPYEDQ
jgi:hypothetical protein